MSGHVLGEQACDEGVRPVQEASVRLYVGREHHAVRVPCGCHARAVQYRSVKSTWEKSDEKRGGAMRKSPKIMKKIM